MISINAAFFPPISASALRIKNIIQLAKTIHKLSSYIANLLLFLFILEVTMFNVDDPVPRFC